MWTYLHIKRRLLQHAAILIGACVASFCLHGCGDDENLFNPNDVNGLYSSSYNWGKANSLTKRLEAGCLFSSIIYPLTFLLFCFWWRIPNFMVLLAENYQVILQRKQTRKRRLQLSKSNATHDLSRSLLTADILEAARKNMSFETPDLTPRSKKSDEEQCGDGQGGAGQNIDVDSDSREYSSDFSREVSEEERLSSSVSDVDDNDEIAETGPLIGRFQEAYAASQQPKSGSLLRSRGSTLHSLEAGTGGTGDGKRASQRRTSTDEARSQFHMFSWVRETILADKRAIRHASGADGVLLTGLLYRLLFLFAVFTLTVSVPMGALYATYEWTTEIEPDQVTLGSKYKFDPEHFGDPGDNLFARPRRNLEAWKQDVPKIEKNHHWHEDRHDKRLVDVDELKDHLTKTVLWIAIPDPSDSTLATKLPPQRVPTVQSLIDICGVGEDADKNARQPCAGATLGLSATRGIKFKPCPTDHELEPQEKYTCDDWFEIPIIDNFGHEDYTLEQLSSLVSDKKFPLLEEEQNVDECGTARVFVLEEPKDEHKKNSMKTVLVSIDGIHIEDFAQAKSKINELIEEGQAKTRIVVNRPESENVIRIKSSATPQLIGKGHNFEKWTVNWMSNHPIEHADHERIPMVTDDGIADINIIAENWSEPVYFHVEEYKPGWIDYISLVHVPFDKADVAGCEGASSRFFVLAVLVWVITFGVLWLIKSMMRLMKKERRRYLKKLDWPQAYALIYKNLPLKKATQHDVELYIDTLFPDRWSSVHICRDVGFGSIRRLYQRYEAANKTYKNALIEANMDINTPPEDLYVYRPSMRSFFSDTLSKVKTPRGSKDSVASGSKKGSKRGALADANAANSGMSTGDESELDKNESDLVNKTEREIESSTKLSAAEKAALRVVRMKKKLRQKWDEENYGEDIRQPIDNPSVIVTFKTRIDKICASDVTLEFKRNKPAVFNASSPKDVRYWDLATTTLRQRTQWIGYGLIVGIFVAFVPFIVTLGSITKPKTIERLFPFLHEWKEEGGLSATVVNVGEIKLMSKIVISGVFEPCERDILAKYSDVDHFSDKILVVIFTYLPPLLLNIVSGVMVLLFLTIGNFLCSFPTGRALNAWVCSIYFWFNMIFIVFGVMAVKILWDVMMRPLAFNDVQSAARALWKQAPDAAVFGITYIFVMIQGMALRLLFNWTRMLMYLWYWMTYKSRSKALELCSLSNDVKYGSFGWMAEVYVYIEVCLAITLSFCLITPVILPVGIIFLLCLLPIMKFNLLVRVPDDFSDSGGQIWMQGVRHLLWIMGFFYIFIICICVLRLSLDAGGGIAVLFIVIAAMVVFFPVAIWMIDRYKFEHLPLYEARKMQDEDESWGMDRSSGRKLDGTSRSFVQAELEFMNHMPKEYKASHSSSWCEERKDMRKHIIADNCIPEEQSVRFSQPQSDVPHVDGVTG